MILRMHGCKGVSRLRRPLQVVREALVHRYAVAIAVPLCSEIAFLQSMTENRQPRLARPGQPCLTSIAH